MAFGTNLKFDSSTGTIAGCAEAVAAAATSNEKPINLRIFFSCRVPSPGTARCVGSALARFGLIRRAIEAIFRQRVARFAAARLHPFRREVNLSGERRHPWPAKGSASEGARDGQPPPDRHCAVEWV